MIEREDSSSIYSDYARQIRNHPNFEARKKMSVPFDGRNLEQYVAYCEERAAENYTNELPGEAEAKFRAFLGILEK